MKQGTLQNRWIIVEDKTGEKIGKICVRVDNPKNVRSRLAAMETQLARVKNEFFKMAEVDPRGERYDKLNELEQSIIEAIEKGFGAPASGVEKLFEKHRPVETVNGKGFFEIVISGLLDGLKQAINQNRQVVSIKIEA
ncbi:MAG: hypothetical protein IJ662_02685 [Clostridia bacterium]|nr:hypothetical protein [Clostridia bacterium]